MSPEELDASVDLEAPEAFKQMDVYSMVLVMWEVMSRCTLTGWCSRVLKWVRCVLFLYIFFSRCRESALLRTLIGSRAACRSRAPDLRSACCFQSELMAKYENYGVPGRSVPP